MGMLFEILREVVTPLSQFGARMASGWIAYQVTHRETDKEAAALLPDLSAYERLNLPELLATDRDSGTSTEQRELEQMLSNAQHLFHDGKAHEARKILEEARKVTSCSRCRTSLDEILAQTGKSATEKLSILQELVPSYMTVLREEERFRAVDIAPSEEECLPCLAEKIAGVCKGDQNCVAYAARIRKEEPKATSAVIIKRVEAFVNK
jgi:hypothetical protein